MRVAVVTSNSPDSSATLQALRSIEEIELREARLSELDRALRPAPRFVVLCLSSEADVATVPAMVKHMAQCPVMVVAPAALLRTVVSSRTVDDFACEGASSEELRARVMRLANTSAAEGETVRRGDLMIDTATCEVSLSGVLVELTFKEYELLKFLASNPGRVYSREILLNSVWGYEYYGGDRTVDVHIRRLRSKIEDANHTFIDTVRNMGYRFRRDS